MLLSVHRWQLFAAAIAGVVISTAPGSVQAQTGNEKERHPEITKLTITGVKSVDKDELLSSMAIEESHCVSLLLEPFCLFSKSSIFYKRAYLDHEELARDVFRARVFYFRRGFRDTQVDTTITPSGKKAVHVTIAVTEGPPTVVSSINVVQADSVLSRRAIARRTVLKPGDPLSLLALDSTEALLRDALWDRGYADAVIDTALVMDSTAHQGAITLNVNPRWRTHVASVAVEGTKALSPRTILKSLSFKPGDLYRRSDVLKSQRTLYESNLFRRATIQVPENDDSLKNVIVSVQEAPLHDASVSMGFNTVDFVQVQGNYTDYNWTGGARRLTLQATVGNLFAKQLNGNGIFYDMASTVVGGSQAKYFAPTYTVSAEFRYPWLGSPNNEGALGAFLHRRSSPGIYVDRGYGFTATFTRTLTQRGPASINYRYEITKVDAGDVYFCVNYGVCDRATLSALRTIQRLSPIALTMSLDKTNDPFEPRRGFRTQVSLEHASKYTASSFHYNRASGDLAAFLPVGRHSTIGAHIRLGFVNALAGTAQAVGLSGSIAGENDILHPRKRFYAGGSQSVRGFAESQLGPRVLTIPAAKLLEIDTSATCTPATITQCNPDLSPNDHDFDPRPLGGNLLAEASVEFRFPLFQNFIGATFVDMGFLSQNTNAALPKSKAAITPGFGVRYLSPVGPIRVDVGINPILREKLPVVTEDVANGGEGLVTLNTRRTYSPAGSGRGLNQILSRLTLHLSIGEAF